MEQRRVSPLKKLKVGVAQIQSVNDPYLNLALTQDFTAMAQDQAVELLCFPENLFFRGPKEGAYGNRVDTVLERNEQGELIVNSAFSHAVAEFVAGLKCVVSLGSVLERSSHAERPYNSHWVCYPGGRIEAYRKIHLFDFTSATSTYRESEEYSAGSEPRAVEVNGWKIGLGICYDLRFAELFRHLVLKHQSEVLLVPAAFARITGEAHWHTLLRARAIENLAYVVASGQWGGHQDSRGQNLFCYGHSLIIDPWGHVLAEAPAEGDALLVHELCADNLEGRRRQLPALQSAKLFQGI